jgi:sulfate transport system permease protein
VILPAILPALLTGFALSFARATGEYGSVVFIAGNMPMVSEIAPLMIIRSSSSTTTPVPRPWPW